MELKEILRIIWKRVWILITIVVVISGSVWAITEYFVTPEFEATNKLIVNSSGTTAQGTQGINLEAINTNLMLINSYKEIIQSSAIMDKVAMMISDHSITANELIRRVEVNSVQNSQVMTVRMKDPSYENAAQIVNLISKVFKEEIPKIMKVDNVTILDIAEMNTSPKKVSPNILLNVMAAIFVSFVLGIGFIFFMEYMDDTLSSEKEIEQMLGLYTLGVISTIRKQDLKKIKLGENNKQVGDSSYVTASQ